MKILGHKTHFHGSWIWRICFFGTLAYIFKELGLNQCRGRVDVMVGYQVHDEGIREAKRLMEAFASLEPCFLGSSACSIMLSENPVWSGCGKRILHAANVLILCCRGHRRLPLPESPSSRPTLWLFSIWQSFTDKNILLVASIQYSSWSISSEFLFSVPNETWERGCIERRQTRGIVEPVSVPSFVLLDR